MIHLDKIMVNLTAISGELQGSGRGAGKGSDSGREQFPIFPDKEELLPIWARYR
jgi:hypothetical protein